MRVRAIALIASILVTTSLFAADPPKKAVAQKLEQLASTFCEQTYALCIKAPCTPIVTYNKKDGTYSIEQADCVCDVLPGWSMGPGACDKRAPQTVNGRTFLVSTYSNFFNKTNLNLSCPSTSQKWAWCYGSPCVVDEKNPSKAICTCPINTGPATTLGGECRQEACNGIWSAATEKDDAYAGNYFYNYMTEHNLQPPPNPPAKDCPATPAN
jgi:hypothetical protein